MGDFFGLETLEGGAELFAGFSLHAYHSCLVRCRFDNRVYIDSMVSISKVGRSLTVGGGHLGDAGYEVLKGEVVY